MEQGRLAENGLCVFHDPEMIDVALDIGMLGEEFQELGAAAGAVEVLEEQGVAGSK